VATARSAGMIRRITRIVLLVRRDGQIHVGTVDAALWERAGRVHRLRPPPVLSHQPPQVAQPVARRVQPERALPEGQVYLRRRRAGIGERGEPGTVARSAFSLASQVAGSPAASPPPPRSDGPPPRPQGVWDRPTTCT